jgi:hypothetical protein
VPCLCFPFRALLVFGVQRSEIISNPQAVFSIFFSFLFSPSGRSALSCFPLRNLRFGAGCKGKKTFRTCNNLAKLFSLFPPGCVSVRSGKRFQLKRAAKVGRVLTSSSAPQKLFFSPSGLCYQPFGERFLLKRGAKVRSFFKAAIPEAKVFFSLFSRRVLFRFPHWWPPCRLPFHSLSPTRATVLGVQRSENFPVPQGAYVNFNLCSEMVPANYLSCTIKFSKIIQKFLLPTSGLYPFS